MKHQGPEDQAHVLPAGSVRRAAVIGAGPVGCATAAHLSRQGLEVTISDVLPAMIKPLRERLSVRCHGVMEGEVPLVSATTDLAEAVEGAELVVAAVPASSHEAVAEAVAGHLMPGAIVLLQPGATLSAVAFMHTLRQVGAGTDVTPVETLNAIFTARMEGPGEVNIFAIKHRIGYAALPARRTAGAGALLEPLFSCLTPMRSVLEISASNMNAVMHPPVTLLNAGRIDSAVPFLFYKEGGTPAVIQLVEAVDRERLALLEALGFSGPSMREWFNEVYGLEATTLYEGIQANRPYDTIKAPTSLDTRLLLEDIPTGLVPYCSLADALGVRVPVMRALVRVCGVLYERDFFAQGRTLANLGLGELTPTELLASFE